MWRILCDCTTTAGGYEYDGKTEIALLSLEETADAVRHALTNGITSFVVCGVFSPARSSQEAQVEQIIKEICHSCESPHSVLKVRTPTIDTSGSARDCRLHSGDLLPATHSISLRTPTGHGMAAFSSMLSGQLMF